MQSGKSWKTSLLEMAFITHGWGPPFEVVPGKGGHHTLKQTESEMGLQAAIATGRNWCARCFASLPEEAREALAAAARPAD